MARPTTPPSPRVTLRRLTLTDAPVILELLNDADFLAFRLSFMQPLANLAFDNDGDGQVTAADFLQFRLRYFQSV